MRKAVLLLAVPVAALALFGCGNDGSAPNYTVVGKHEDPRLYDYRITIVLFGEDREIEVPYGCYLAARVGQTLPERVVPPPLDANFSLTFLEVRRDGDVAYIRDLERSDYGLCY